MNLNESLIFYQNKLQRLEPKHYNLLTPNLDLKSKRTRFLLAILALNLELSIVPVSSQDFNVVLAKYKWWEEELTNISSTKNRNHPLLIILRNLIPEYQHLQETSEKILTARKQDYKGKKFSNYNEIEEYLNSIHFVIFYNYLKEFKHSINKEEIDLLKNLIHALKAKNIYKSLQIREYNNHPFIPLDLLSELNDTPSFARNKKAKELIQQYGKAKWQKGKEIRKTDLFKQSQLIKNLYNEAKRDFSLIANLPFL